MIQAAINGTRSKNEHLQLPVSLAELVRDCGQVIGAGASTIHLHPRDADGLESLAADEICSQLKTLKKSYPGTTFGISTGHWIDNDVEKTVRNISDWTTLPDYASVNFNEPGHEDVFESLLFRGVRVEAGISDVEAARTFLHYNQCGRTSRVLIEPASQDIGTALNTIKGILEIIRPISIPELILHGVDRTCWPILKYALTTGHGVRIGLEDTLFSENGVTASNNEALVEQAVNLRNKMIKAKGKD